jgi:hypothetical protein
VTEPLCEVWGVELHAAVAASERQVLKLVLRRELTDQEVHKLDRSEEALESKVGSDSRSKCHGSITQAQE